jgi:hypothetical protein
MPDPHDTPASIDDAGSLSHGQRWLAVLLLLATLAFWAGLVGLMLHQARLGPEASGTVVVVFPRVMDRADRFTGLIGAEGRLVRTTWFDNIWVVHGDGPGFAGRLRAAGAIEVMAYAPFQPVMLGGCFFDSFIMRQQ